jgi:hypothetical protein
MKMIPLRMGCRLGEAETAGLDWDGADGLHAWRIPGLKMKVYSPRVDSGGEIRVSLEGEGKI